MSDLDITEQDGVSVVSLGSTYESFDPKEMQHLSETLLACVDESAPPRLVLDMTQTKFLDSTFLETLFRVWKRVKQRSGDMALCGLDANCAKVLQVTRLDTIWTVCSTREEAIGKIKG